MMVNPANASEYLQYDLSNQLANTQALMLGQQQSRGGAGNKAGSSKQHVVQMLNSTAPLNLQNKAPNAQTTIS